MLVDVLFQMSSVHVYNFYVHVMCVCTRTFMCYYRSSTCQCLFPSSCMGSDCTLDRQTLLSAPVVPRCSLSISSLAYDLTALLIVQTLLSAHVVPRCSLSISSLACDLTALLIVQTLLSAHVVPRCSLSISSLATRLSLSVCL